MEYAIDRNGEGLVLRISGELNIYGALIAKEAVAKAMAVQEAATITMELGDVSEIDTAGLQILVLASKEARRFGKTFRVANPSRPVAEVLGLLGMTDSIESA